MKSRKGEYYIACCKNGEIYLHKKTGYILDDWKNQYGMCRGEDGLYRITDLKTGALLNIPVQGNYSIAHTYIQLQRIVKESGGRLDAWRRKREFREAARKIRAAHEADERWNAMSEEERKENTRACIAAAKIVGEALLQKMREEYKT